MFEFLFKYPASAFSRGTIVFLGSWPKWVLLGGIVLSAAILALVIWRGKSRLRSTVRGWHAVVLWLLQSALLATLLLLLWQPAISVTSLKPQQNIVAVIVDDSRSMSAKDGSETRSAVARRILDSNLLNDLGKRFQVRLYRMGSGVERVSATSQLAANQPSTQIGKSLRQISDEAATLPIGAAILLTDGADNSGGLDSDTLAEIRRRRIPVSTVGIGSEQVPDDVELSAFSLPPKTLAGARLQAEVTIKQHGFSGKHARLVLTNAGTVLATRDITLQSTPEQQETIEFHAGKAAVKSVTARIDPLPGETNKDNNAQTLAVAVDDSRRRILYVEGEPRWDYKFLRRAVEDDPALQVVSMLRTTQNKIYRQGIASPNELAEGFPAKGEDLFGYQGIILGSVEAAFFTTAQQELIKDFVDRRGGGLLFLGGRSCLSDGGYNIQPFAELLPVSLPNKKNTFQRTFVPAELTEAGKRSLICRIDENADKSTAHWEVLPYLANYQDSGTPKPGATVLARVNVAGNKIPLLVTENYGRGRTAVFATGGSWRWRMQQPVGDNSEETFWRQLLRWTVSATPSRVVLSTKNATLEDDGQVELRAEVRDNVYLPTSGADVQVHMVAPDGTTEDIPLRPEPLTQGVYTAKWNAPKAGLYVAEARAKDGTRTLGKDTWAFRREDGVAENFHREANQDLLRRLAEQTGGRYYKPQDVSRLASEVAYSEAGINSRELKDLWDMPAILLLMLTLEICRVAPPAAVGRGMKLLALLLGASLSLSAANYFVTVVGLGGAPEYDTQFAKWASDLNKQLETGGPDVHVIELASAAATRAKLTETLTRLSGEITADDAFGLFLIGHGSFDGDEYKFNVPGPDITAHELAALINKLPARRQLVVNMTSCSGASFSVLSRKDRVVITATKSGTEKNAPVFARYWVDALRDPAADADKNGTVSALEAFTYAQRKTAAYFESEKLLATEHSMMADSGRSDGVRTITAGDREGALAAAFPLIRPESAIAKNASPEKQKLVSRKEDLEAKIDRLKYQKAALAPEVYRQQLSALLLELARTQAEIDR